MVRSVCRATVSSGIGPPRERRVAYLAPPRTAAFLRLVLVAAVVTGEGLVNVRVNLAVTGPQVIPVDVEAHNGTSLTLPSGLTSNRAMHPRGYQPRSMWRSS